MSAVGNGLILMSLVLGQVRSEPDATTTQVVAPEHVPAQASAAPPPRMITLTCLEDPALAPRVSVGIVTEEEPSAWRGWFRFPRLFAFRRSRPSPEPPLVDAPTSAWAKVPAAAGPPAAAPVAESLAPLAAPMLNSEASGRANDKGPILAALVNKVGRDEKFAWVTGQLEIEDGKHVIYYATPETVDPCQGRVVLQTAADLSQFAQGDLVAVAGQLQGAPGPNMVYLATTVVLVESPWQASK